LKKIYLLISILFISFAFLSCSESTTQEMTYEPTTNIEMTIEIGTEFSLFEMAKYHSIAITPNNQVYGWGNNQFGQLGELSNSSSNIVNLTHYFELSTNEDIIDIALGDFHSSILTSEGHLFAWGSNAQGQIGDETTNSRYIPVEVSQHFNLNQDERLIDIESGAGNMMALTSEGRVFSWGYNDYGQVGLGPTNSAYTEAVDITDSLNLSLNEEVQKISIGYHHSAILTSNGRILLWGYNNVGQLGNGTIASVFMPTDHTQYLPLRDGEVITDIELGYYHSMVLTSDNRVFVWGLNENGQLGNQSRDSLLFPTDITEEFDLDEDDFITSLSLGGWMSSAISNDGQVFMWGSNGQGRLAMTAARDFLIPTKILDQFDLYENEVIEEVILGAWSSSALTSYGRLFTWGRNNTFQLGYNFNQESNPEPGQIIIE